MTPTAHPAWTKESAVLRLDLLHDLPDKLTADWALGGGNGRGVRVAVVDSGVDADHPGLGGAVDAAAGVLVAIHDDDVAIMSGRHDDVFGHGTACAGIIHHLAPEATIVSVRVLDDRLGGRAASFHAGLEWAIDQGFDVVNLSLGSSKREWALAFHELCDRAYFEGVVVVTAANNVLRPSYPSLYSSAFSVACNTTTDPERFHVNPTPPTEFLARGIDVPVLWRDGGTTMGTGNSYASPHIAGIVARLLSNHPGLRPFQVKSVLWATAANVREPATAPAAGRLTQMRARSTATNLRRSTLAI